MREIKKTGDNSDYDKYGSFIVLFCFMRLMNRLFRRKKKKERKNTKKEKGMKKKGRKKKRKKTQIN